jgi:hypothetical protein
MGTQDRPAESGPRCIRRFLRAETGGVLAMLAQPLRRSGAKRERRRDFD